MRPIRFPRHPLRQLAVTVCLLLWIAPVAWSQSSRPGGGTSSTGTTHLGLLSRLKDAARLREESIASLKITYREGTLSTSMEKYVPNALFVRAKLDDKPIKLARGAKTKHVEGVLPGTLVIDIEQPVHSTRKRGECIGYLAEGVQEVLIYPGGEEGVTCQFYDVEVDGAKAVEVKEGAEEMISEWEGNLTFEQFELVGTCLNDHERGSVEFWTCVEEAGVPTPGS